MLRIKARIETPTGHKDLVRIEEVTIVLGDEALAEIAKVITSQQSFVPDGAYWVCPKCNSFCSVKFDTCGLCKSPRR